MALQKLNLKQKFYNLEKEEATLKNTVLAEGHYIGPVQGKYGPQYTFRDDERGVVTLGGGQLKKAVSSGLIREGDYVQITYLGMEVMSAGNFAGKKVHSFDIATDPEKRIGQDAAAAFTVAVDNEPTLAPAEVVAAQEVVAENVAATQAAPTAPKLSPAELLAKHRK